MAILNEYLVFKRVQNYAHVLSIIRICAYIIRELIFVIISEIAIQQELV